MQIASKNAASCGAGARRVDVVDSEADMVQAGAAAGEELGVHGLPRHRLDQLGQVTRRRDRSCRHLTSIRKGGEQLVGGRVRVGLPGHDALGELVELRARVHVAPPLAQRRDRDRLDLLARAAHPPRLELT